MRVKSRDSSFIHDSASIMGDLVIWEECPIAAGAVLRGDYGSIRVGNRTSVQKNSVLHARFREACIVGSDLQIGHGSVIHNCERKISR